MEADTNAFTDAEKTKLGTVDATATPDQTGAEIKVAYELEADTNAFTDAEKTKLGAIEASATADQSNSEIKTAYEANADTNAFTDANVTKLGAIEAAATADQTNVEIQTAYNAQVPQISAGEKTAGTEVAIRRVSPADVKSMIDTHAAGGGGASQTYSTTEYDTGKVWIDGKTIYGKVINDTGSGTYSTGTNSIAHGLTFTAGSGNVETIVDLEGFVKRDSANENIPINYGSVSGASWSVSTVIGDTNIKLAVGTNWNGASTTSLSDAIISIEYTKQT